MLNEYLNRLSELLDSLDTDERNSILDFMQEMIEDRTENGEALEDVLKAIGTPEKVAADFVSDRSDIRKEIVIIDEEEDHQTEKHLEFTDVRKIEIDSVSYDYDFLPSADDRFTVDYTEGTYTTLNVRLSGSTLLIEQEFEDTDFSGIFRRWMNRNTRNTEKVHATVYVPESSAVKLEIDNVNGRLSFNDVAFDNAEIDNVSGNVEFNNVLIQRLQSDDVNGAIRFNELKVAKRASFDMVNGSIRGQRFSCERIDVETVNGSVDLEIVGSPEDWDISIEGLLKNKTIRGNGNCRLHAETVNGSIDYRFTD